MTPPIGMCGACREGDCECCDLLVWGGPCDCGCYAPEPIPRAPFHTQPILIVLNKRYQPVPPRPKQRTHCNRGHKLAGRNLYIENGDANKRRCWECRRASWRRYQYRKYQRNGGQVA